MKQNSIQKTFLKSILSFGMVQVLSQMVSFFLLPLYTAKLSTSDYGVMEYVSIINTVLLIIFSFQVQQGVIRQLVDAKSDDEKSNFISTSFWFVLASFSILVILQWLIYIFFNKQLYYNNEHLSLIPITLGTLFFTGINTFFNSILVWSLRSVTSSIISGVSIIVNISLAITFVLYLDMGIKGTLLAAMIAQLIITPFLLWANKDFLKLKFNVTSIISNLKFSVPMIFSVLAYYSWYFVDRYLLNKFLGPSDLGIFSVAMRFAAPIALVLTVIETSVFPIVLNNYKDEKTKHFLINLFNGITLGTIFCLLIVACFSSFIFEFMVKGDFVKGHQNWLLLCLGQLFSKMYYFNPGFAIQKKTNYFLAITLVGSVINFLLNLYFIPQFQVLGACIATCISSFIYFCILFYVSNKLFPIPYKYVLPIINLIILILVFLFQIYTNYKFQVASFLLSVVLVLVLNKNSIMSLILLCSDYFKKNKQIVSN